jgi:hypothetical protein
VETIGDCYVAVCFGVDTDVSCIQKFNSLSHLAYCFQKKVSGLPEPRKDHAPAMARFARDIQMVMKTLCKDLENTLGPDTGDLGLRVGLHRYVQ